MSEEPRHSRPDRAVRRRVALRSALLQSVWNYETLQSIGFAWALLPGLKRIYPDRSERARRLLSYLDPFNSNPYLATLGLGLSLRMESEVARGAAAAPERLRRLLRALRGSLGAVGDELFWAGWRPALGLVASLATVWSSSPWPAVAFVLLYNALAQGIRLDGVDSGYAAGAGIARALRRPFWQTAARWSGRTGAFAAGVAVGAGGVVSTLGGGTPGAIVFFGLVGLVWVAAGAGRTRRALTPSLAFLLALFLLSIVSRTHPGVMPP